MSVAPAEPLTAHGRALDLAGPAPWQLLTAVLLAAALMLGVLAPLPDVSWLTVAAAKVMGGERLYSQVMEVNPPLSVLLYMPPVLLARVLGIAPETASAGLCVLALATSLWLSARILRPLLGPDRTGSWKMAAGAAFVLGVMPAVAFGQREHIAVMALLPFVALCQLRAEGHRPDWRLAAIAGLGMGVAVCIKPHFAAMAGLPLLLSMWKARSFRPWAQPELWTAAGAAAAYAAAVVVFFPNFLTDFVPVALATYVPIRSPLWLLLVLPGVPLAFGAFVAARLLKLEGRWLAIPMLAAVGGALAFLAQGKGWPYHAYPMLAFAMLGLLAAAAMTPVSEAGRDRYLRSLALLPPLVGMAWLATGILPGPLAPAVAAIAPPNPKLIGVSGVGLTLVRPLHARWVGRECIEWISDGVIRREASEHLAPAERARLDAMQDAERQRLGQDIVSARPDIILYARRGFDWRAWSLKDPAIAAAMKSYRLATTVQGVEVWRRI